MPRIETSLLLTKVGRRIVLLFGICALLPITALAVISIYQGSRELQAEAEQRLHREAKSRAMRVAERLTLIEGDLKDLGESLVVGALEERIDSLQYEAQLEGRVLGLARLVEDGELVHLWGQPIDPPLLDSDMRHQLLDPVEGERRGVIIFPDPDLGPDQPLLLARSSPSLAALGQALWAILDPVYLWYGTGARDTVPEDEVLFVLDPDRNMIHSSGPTDYVVPSELAGAVGISAPNSEWSDGVETWVSGHFNLPLSYQYLAPPMTVVLSQRRETFMQPVANFRRWLFLVALASVWVVFILSLSQIRKSLVPLQKLQEGTSRIANRDFNARVQITSGDEFQDLGAAFNGMAARLGQQFSTLGALHRIAGVGLIAEDTESLAIGVLDRLASTFSHRPRLLVVLEGGGANGMIYYSAGGREAGRPSVTSITMSPGEKELLETSRSVLTLEPPADPGSFLAPIASGSQTFVALPVFLDEKLAGALAVGFPRQAPSDVDSVRQLRQIAEQIGAALAHVRLIVHVQNLYKGTLRALSRTIDAKSKWTQGHSERVTRMAVRLARQIGLPETEIMIIDRGGQLHDIGKIGVPAALLDKPGALTPEERKKIEAHTLIGERILEPIPGFDDVIPMVGQHHEWFDGGGYPRGLKGEEINYYARILAVADTYDALRSDRPYRGAIPREEVISYILGRSGSQFDPDVIEAFKKLVPSTVDEKASPIMYL